MKYYLRLGFVLLIIAAVASGILAYINSVTLPIINNSEKKAQQEARKNVLSSANFFEKDSIRVEQAQENDPLKIQAESAENWFEFYRGFDAEKNLIGYTFQAAKYGYSSDLKTMVGLDNNLKIVQIQIVSQAETPGLGAKCTETSFAQMFSGLSRDELKVDKDGGEITSITGATITTRAITVSIAEAIGILAENLEAGGQDE
ncbi:MAG: RnfABCDGE type electron transport complex subunit G [Candidatus Cloacimonadales bacterium]